MRFWWSPDTGNGAGSSIGAALLLLMMAQLVRGRYVLNVTSPDSVRSVASDMTDDMMSFYTGNLPGQTPGLLPMPYYWWEGGAMMGALIDYWYYTGDTKWNDIAMQGLLWQVGPNNDYMPPNQTLTEGNDDQGFWVCYESNATCTSCQTLDKAEADFDFYRGMAVMSAAEYNFDDPPPNQPQWLALAQATFNTQAARWETAECGGGLRWQIFTWNNGFTYKNSISQACFFNLAARLALYTGNATYAEWAERTWDWMVTVRLMHEDSYYVYDGTYITDNCTAVTPYQWTYNAGAFLHGAAAMYNFSTGPARVLWRERTDGLLNGTSVFLKGDRFNIITEVACEPVDLCDLNQQSFKAYLSRWMAATTKWAPWTYDRVKSLLDINAEAAASQCTGGRNGRMCGHKWTNNGQWDGSTGVGQQMAAMEIVLSTMIEKVTFPVTNNTGGTSRGDPAAGGSDVGRMHPSNLIDADPIETKDEAGAWFLTVLAVVLLIVAVGFMVHDETSDKPFAERWTNFKAEMAPGGILRKGLPPIPNQKEKGKGIDRSFSNTSSNAAFAVGRGMDGTGGEMEEYLSSPMANIFDMQPRRSIESSQQAWTRPAREGDYAGAFDPTRGNSAGFGTGGIMQDSSSDTGSASAPAPQQHQQQRVQQFSTGGRNLMKRGTPACNGRADFTA